MFRPVSSKPDFVAQEHEILALWRERRTFARLRAQNAGGPTLELPRRPDHGQQPDGRPPRLGPRPTRTSTSASTRCSARTSATRTASTARACGSRSTSSATSASPASATSRRTASPSSSRLCKQRVLTYAARQTEQSIRLGHVDGLERSRTSCAGCATCSARTRPQVTTIEGPDGPVTDTVEMLVGRLGHARDRRHLLHVQQREQRPDLGLPGRVPPARLAVQGPRHDAVVRALRHRHLARWR